MIELVPVNEPKKRIELSVPVSTLAQIDKRRRNFAFKTRTAFMTDAALQYGASARLAELEALSDMAQTLHEIRDLCAMEDHHDARLERLLASAEKFFRRHLPPVED